MTIKILSNILLLIIFSCNISCSQTIDSNAVKAQQYINEAVKIMYMVPKESDTEFKAHANVRKATELLEESLRLDSSKRLAFQILCECYIKLSERENAIKIISKWLNTHDDDIGMIITRSMLYERLNDSANAKKDFDSAKPIIQKFILTIGENPRENQIEEIKAYAIFYTVINEKSKAINLLLNLEKKYPNNNSLKETISKIEVFDRKEYIYNMTGY